MRLAREKPRYGYRRLQVLVEGEGERVNRKRLWRVYREAGLRLKRKKRRHCVRVGSPRPALSSAAASATELRPSLHVRPQPRAMEDDVGLPDLLYQRDC